MLECKDVKKRKTMPYCMKHIQANWNSPAPQNGQAAAKTFALNGAFLTVEAPKTGIRLTA